MGTTKNPQRPKPIPIPTGLPTKLDARARELGTTPEGVVRQAVRAMKGKGS